MKTLLKNMKSQLFTLLLIVLGYSSVTAQATSYTAFEWDIIRLGFAVPQGSDELKAGIAFGGEIRYNLSDNLSIGLGSDYTFFSSENDAVDVGLTDNFALVGDYYLSATSPNRAFVGIGIGYASDDDVVSGDDTILIEKASGAIITPRIGYELGHVRLTGTYNLGLKDELTNFFSLNVAITLWGGYKG